MTAGPLVGGLPPSKSYTVTGRLWSAAARFSFFPPNTINADWSVLYLKEEKSAAFDRRDWQSVLAISENPFSKFIFDQVKRKLSCFSRVLAVTLKWPRVMTVLRIFRWIHRQRFHYVNHRPVLLPSAHAWNQLHRPVSNCHFLFPGFWDSKINLFNVRQIHSLVSKIVISYFIYYHG